MGRKKPSPPRRAYLVWGEPEEARKLVVPHGPDVVLEVGDLVRFGNELHQIVVIGRRKVVPEGLGLRETLVWAVRR